MAEEILKNEFVKYNNYDFNNNYMDFEDSTKNDIIINKYQSNNINNLSIIKKNNLDHIPIPADKYERYEYNLINDEQMKPPVLLFSTISTNIMSNLVQYSSDNKPFVLATQETPIPIQETIIPIQEIPIQETTIPKYAFNYQSVLNKDQQIINQNQDNTEQDIIISNEQLNIQSNHSLNKIDSTIPNQKHDNINVDIIMPFHPDDMIDSNIYFQTYNTPVQSSNIPHQIFYIPYNISSNIPIQSSNIPIKSSNIPIQSSNIPIQSSNIPIQSSNISIQSSNINNSSNILENVILKESSQSIFNNKSYKSSEAPSGFIMSQIELGASIN